MQPIYICYRGFETDGIAGRIYDHLAAEFGAENVFRDAEDINPGEDFNLIMREALKTTEVVIAVIGPTWLQRPFSDYISNELRVGLSEGKRIIPVLVDGARISDVRDIPDEFQGLLDRDMVEVRKGRYFRRDVIELISYIRSTFPNIDKTKGQTSSDVFIVHGRDDAAKEGVARLVENQGLKAKILSDLPSMGMTIVEKFEYYAKNAAFAIVLMTADDIGSLKAAPEAAQPRSRQNVIFELGYFVALLKRNKIALLHKGSPEIPSDLYGIVYIDMASENWRLKLLQEMRAAGLTVDLNKLLSG